MGSSGIIAKFPTQGRCPVELTESLAFIIAVQTRVHVCNAAVARHVQCSSSLTQCTSPTQGTFSVSADRCTAVSCASCMMPRIAVALV
jgi:hypothetical protein